jgi:hypothetical protein
VPLSAPRVRTSILETFQLAVKRIDAPGAQALPHKVSAALSRTDYVDWLPPPSIVRIDGSGGFFQLGCYSGFGNIDLSLAQRGACPTKSYISGRIPHMLRRGFLLLLCVLILLMGGCATRQGPARIVYVSTPAPPAVGTTPSTLPGVMVIEEPSPPQEPEENNSSQATEPKPLEQKKQPARVDAPAEPVEVQAPPETPEPPPAAVPALAPRESTAEEASLRQQIQQLHEDVRQRMARLNKARLSSSGRKTLEDASTFFVQSTRALASGDLQRALNLAKKASLLVSALE